jgi:hypothetical protein
MKQTLTQRVEALENRLNKLEPKVSQHENELSTIARCRGCISKILEDKPYTAQASTEKKLPMIIQCQWCGATCPDDKPFTHFDGCENIKPQEGVTGALRDLQVFVTDPCTHSRTQIVNEIDKIIKLLNK